MLEIDRRFLMLALFAVVGGALAFLLFGSVGFVYVSAFVTSLSLVVLR